MNIVPKLQTAWSPIVMQSDNTRIQKPLIPRTIKYKLKPGETFFTDRRTGKKSVIKPRNEVVRADNRSSYQRQQDNIATRRYKQQYQEQKNQEEASKTLDAIGKLVSPSTYVGALVKRNGKSVGDNLMSGEGTGSTAGNVAIDMLTPFAIGGATKVSSRLLPKTVTVYKGGIKPFTNDYTFFTTDKEFKSELDWSPRSWFEDVGDWGDYTQTDIDALASHVPEYHEIERAAKANGIWLKMPDGSTWKGDPRSWVQLMSKDGQKLSKTIYWHGDTNKYIAASGEDVTPIKNGKRILWGSSKPHIARSYTNSDSKVMPFVLKANQQPLREIDAEGRIWKSAYKKNGKYYDTNTFSLENLKNGEYLVINNVIDKGSMFVPKNSKYYISSQPNESYTDYLIRTQKGNDIIVGKNTPRKFLVGNNGNFNLLDPNVFRIGVPIITFSAYDKFSK